MLLLLVIAILFFVYVCLTYKKYFYDVKLAIHLYIFLLVVSDILLANFNDGFMPGAPDQYGYFDFSLDGSKLIEQLGLIDTYKYIGEKISPKPFFWFIVSIVQKYSFNYSTTLHLVNGCFHLVAAHYAYKTVSLVTCGDKKKSKLFTFFFCCPQAS